MWFITSTFTSKKLNIQQNATLFNNPPLVYPTLYASPLITLTKQGYTKHYFEEGRRICSKIGGGMQGNVTVEEIDSRVGELASSYEKQYHTQNDGIRQTFHDCIGADPQIIDGVNLHQMLVDREVQRDEEEPTYFYHGDHLGSAAYLTYHGGVIQTLNYLPYGEDWIDVQNNMGPRLGQYRFNGKEKDYESGFHYYGARYYWSEVMTMWLSVDPMADKYPSISPYAYCAWNPIKLVDPDGKEIVIKDGQKSYYYINGHVYTNNKGRGPIWDSRLGQEAKKIKGNLDLLLKDKAGKKVVGCLTGSDDKYTIAADAKTGYGNYKASSKKVSLVSGDLNNLETLSHELFHAYQDDNKRTPHTIYNEIEAYIFSGMVSKKPTAGMVSDKNPEYMKHANKMMNGFSAKSFKYLVCHFRRDSQANNLLGTYNSYDFNPGHYSPNQSLLKDL